MNTTPDAPLTSRTSQAIASAAIALIAAVVVACGGAGPSAAPSTAATAPSSMRPAASPLSTVDPSALSTTPVGGSVAWVLDQVNGKASKLTAADLPARFSPAFLAGVPAAQLLAVLKNVAATGPYALTRYGTSPQGFEAAARITAATTSFDVSVVVDTASPNLITLLLFEPARELPSAASWGELDAELGKIAPEVSVFAAEVKAGKCEPVHGLNSDRKLAIGSAFKLYVLGELARQVGTGKLSWDEQLSIREEWKSVPSGKMQDEPAGTRHSVSYFAGQMISISDNTAADHLIHLLGRERVEANLTEMGMTDPSKNAPFLLTRDMVVLKATGNDALAKSYLAADAAGRRTLLDGTVASMPVSAANQGNWPTPRYIHEIEWFAGTADLCAAMAGLQATGSKPGMGAVMDALSINPGMDMDPAAWTYVGYKGGSEPGVLNLTWLLRRADNRWFVLSMTLNDPASAADNSPPAGSLATDALRLLAQVE